MFIDQSQIKALFKSGVTSAIPITASSATLTATCFSFQNLSSNFQDLNSQAKRLANNQGLVLNSNQASLLYDFKDKEEQQEESSITCNNNK